MIKYAKALALDHFPRRDPFKLGDHLGTKEAVIVAILDQCFGGEQEGDSSQFGTAYGKCDPPSQF